MANKIINTDFITAIANAIRQKLGTSDPISIANMPSSIESIPSGGESKLPQLIDRSITTLTASDFGNATKIGMGAFAGCKSLTSAVIPESITSIGESAFDECSALETITIPSQLKSLGSNAFDNCRKLSSITLPETLAGIGSYCFRNCVALTSITIPSSVNNILNYATTGCSNLNTITVMGRPSLNYTNCLVGGSSTTYYFYSTNPPLLHSSALSGTSNIVKIYVPKDCGKTYKEASNWSKYADYITEMDEDGYYYEPVEEPIEEIINEEDE